MAKLFVEKTIEINAPVSKVWDVLTSPEYTSEWAPEFSGGSEFLLSPIGNLAAGCSGRIGTAT